MTTNSDRENNNLEDIVRAFAFRLGFDSVRFTSAAPFFQRTSVALERVEQGLMDGLPWYNEKRVERGAFPTHLLPGARSIIALSMSYNAAPSYENTAMPMGRVARYAWGQDYHRVLERRMRDFVRGLADIVGHPVKTKNYVDTGPMQDRAIAERAGIGWFGKNTNILTSSHGSWVFLAQVLTDLELTPDSPLKKTCGACQVCIEECPTGAIVAPYVIDNKRCISYLTIELRGIVPRNLRSLMGDWVFGCDICQDVCPVNRKALPAQEPAFAPGEYGYTALELIPLLDITEEEFQERFQGSAIRRAKRIGLQRNVCIALGNIGEAIAVPALAHALGSGDVVVRCHAAWALGRIRTPDAIENLNSVLLSESDSGVLEEIRDALVQACGRF